MFALWLLGALTARATWWRPPSTRARRWLCDGIPNVRKLYLPALLSPAPICCDFFCRVDYITEWLSQVMWFMKTLNHWGSLLLNLWTQVVNTSVGDSYTDLQKQKTLLAPLYLSLHVPFILILQVAFSNLMRYFWEKFRKTEPLTHIHDYENSNTLPASHSNPAVEFYE